MARRKPRKPKASGNYEAKGSTTSKSTQTSNAPEKEASKADESKATDKPIGGAGYGKEVALGATPANDPAWYGMDQQLLIDSASFPYAYPFGQAFTLMEKEDRPAEHDEKHVILGQSKSDIPGICSLVIKPTIGYAKDRLSPVNVAANAFYTHVRVANSGRKNYDPCDLMMFALTVADVYSFLFWCERLYNYAFTFSARNKYIGDALIKENNVDYRDIRLNLANFRYWINSFINKISAWAVPADINLFKRRAFLYSNYYLENGYGNIKDQMYQFVPMCFMKFEYDDVGAGKLTPKLLYEFGESKLLTVSKIMEYGENLIENIYGDEDFAIMSGDIIKAYGSNIIGISPLQEDAGITPSYDPYTLSQFKNADVVYTNLNLKQELNVDLDADYDIPDADGQLTRKGNPGEIIQDGIGNIQCREVACASLAQAQDMAGFMSRYEGYISAKMNKVLSVENPIPGPADSIEASRLKLTIADREDEPFKINSSLYGYTFLTSGTEIVCKVKFLKSADIVYSEGGDDEDVIVTSNIYAHSSFDEGLGTESKVAASVFYNALIASQFKYSPIMYSGVYSEDSADLTVPQKFIQMQLRSNVDNFTLVGPKELSKMHECALLSLFYVPGIAKMINYN